MAGKKKPRVIQVMFFANGNTAAFDENGEQVVEIQKRGWLRLAIASLEEYGVTDLEGIDFRMPSGALMEWDNKSNGWRIR